LISILVFLSLGIASAAPPQELRVLSYQSMDFALIQGFEKKCSCKVLIQTAGDGAQILSKLELAAVRKRMDAQVVVGIDQTLWPQASKYAVNLEVSLDAVPEVGDMGPAFLGFVPLDWGVMALMMRDGELQAPVSWNTLLEARLRKRLILEDPRTSTPGFGFVWGASQAVQDPKSYFSKLRTQWLTLASGWSGAYGLFLNQQAPLVWSYTTSQAYHVAHAEKHPGEKVQYRALYRAVVFEEGNPIQIEGAFAVRDAVRTPEERKLARDFLAYLVSSDVQQEIALKQWMFPALRGVKLPQAFAGLPKPRRILKWDPAQHDFRALTRAWEGWIRQ